jgi:molecular chaperone IbpA
MPHSQSYPRYNLVDNDTGFKLEIAVPGWSKKELEVVLKDNELRISGSKSNKGEDSYLHQGLSQKSFDRRFVLNSDLEVKSVKLENGMLDIEMTQTAGNKTVLEIQ